MLTYDNELDVKSYNMLREAVGWGGLEEDQAKLGIAQSAYVITCRDNGHVVASARVVSDGCCVAYIADVMVLPEYQRQGIGKEMMKHIMDYIRGGLQEGWKIMVVLLSAKGKEDFYKKFGFDVRPNEYYGPGMFKQIRID